ncbi:hypothetical protein ACS0TY_002845 [Phlomoides rotata]
MPLLLPKEKMQIPLNHQLAMSLIFSSWTLSLHLFLFPIIVSSLSFNFSSFETSDMNVNISAQGGAYISQEEGLQLTTTDESRILTSNGTGRAIYVKPFHLWDKSSGNLTDFDTQFSFVIQSFKDNCSADGLAFFLAPVDSSIPPKSSGGGLGLAYNNVTANVSGVPFIAVEFDTFSNDWDPVGAHVGIDINSLRSAQSAQWLSNMTTGKINDAQVRYDSTTKSLSVAFTSYDGNETSSFNHIVDLRNYLPEWVSVGFSGATGLCYERNNVKSWSFNSKDFQLQNRVPAPTIAPAISPPTLSPLPRPRGKKNGKKAGGEVIGLAVGLFVLLLAMSTLLGCYLSRKKKNGKGGEEEDFAFDVSMETEFERGSGPKKFSYGELACATDNFSEEQKLGEGGFGGVYKGFLKDLKSHAAVKRVSKNSKQGPKEYASEVNIISQLRHKNLVKLIGWCHEKRELLLVYEFLPSGSLDSHLFKQHFSLTWETRYKVAQGLASALLYLHEEWEQCVLHRDIKSSNVMLDSNFNAKLGDFGLARLVDHEDGSKTTVMAGTLGYMAPECMSTGKASKESDVYSFGIVALEIACGRRPIDLGAPENQVRMLEWVWELYGRGVHLEAADPKLGRGYNEEEMVRLMVVGLWCAHPDHTLRPSIRQAIHVLSFEAHELPLLPSKLPVPTYLVPPRNTLASSSLSHADPSNGNIYKPVSGTSDTTSSSAASSSPSVSLLYSI